MIAGLATPEGTDRFRRRFPALDGAGHFRRIASAGGLWLSSIGLGTSQGAEDDAADQGYEEAIRLALASGCNVFDTAISYREERSERALGRALARAFTEGLAARDEVFVATKGGLKGEISAGQLAPSRVNLGLLAVDLYFLHNPETRLSELSRPELEERLAGAFAELEAAADRGEIGLYGVATWDGLRVPPSDPGHLGLARLAEIAGPRFRAVELPLNIAFPEALVAPTQELDGVRIPALAAARKLALSVFTSGSIQKRLGYSVPPAIAQVFPDLATDAQRVLQFTRSAPGVAVALVGMGRADHVAENLAVAAVPPAGLETFQWIFGG
ncbi:MAG TPA: aldo/keto reductase [Thermoanaerobaculia bacterium]|nr:aldo/keto reductase [Thermoanaerobaculia bacterium]